MIVELTDSCDSQTVLIWLIEIYTSTGHYEVGCARVCTYADIFTFRRHLSTNQKPLAHLQLPRLALKRPTDPVESVSVPVQVGSNLLDHRDVPHCPAQPGLAGVWGPLPLPVP